MTKTATLQQALNEIASFDTASDLGIFLASKGVKGIRRSANKCPIAVRLSEQTGHRVIVGVHEAIDTDLRSDDKSRYAVTPWVVAEFIEGFDTGMYPDLAVPEAAS